MAPDRMAEIKITKEKNRPPESPEASVNIGHFSDPGSLI
jgi:hypothetical protein